ncbi:hypothetical protein DRO54_00175 [Candidatus Bathyarchaeota archaeon]|nr:MAG: hypothetical protein DRO54_00175 [Candidatus Bathyarchaeota archaeon]
MSSPNQHTRKSSTHYFSEKPQVKPKYGIIRVYLRDRYFEFLTCSGVFSPKKIDLGTRLLIESMILPDEGSVLDLGCGYGPVGIVAAALNPKLHVIMVDVNERAIMLARENAKRNFIKNIEVRKGYLYEPVKNLKFNAILCNPPISAGKETIRKIITEAPAHLTRNGLLEVVVRSKIGGKMVKEMMMETFGNVQVHARQSGYRVLISKN